MKYLTVGIKSPSLRRVWVDIGITLMSALIVVVTLLAEGVG